MGALVSVIIPVYNAEKYLCDCVDSVLAQTYTELEILLIDDGSKDASGNICDEYAAKDSRIRVIHKQNGGASTARNAGLDAAKGDYIYFVDSDDYIAEDTVEKLLGKAGESEADLVFFDAYSLTANSGELSTANYSHKVRYETGAGYPMLLEMVKNKEFRVVVYLFFIKKELLDKTLLRFCEGIMYEDAIFAYELFYYAAKVAYLPEYLYYRRYREGSVMTSKISAKNYVSGERVYYELKEFIKEHSIKDNNYIVRYCFNALDCYRALGAADKKKYKADFKKLKNDILESGAYGDKSLKMSCYGKPLWAAYKVIGKFFGKC